MKNRYILMILVVMAGASCKGQTHDTDAALKALVRRAKDGSGEAIRSLGRMSDLIENDPKLTKIITKKEIADLVYKNAAEGDAITQLGVFINGKSGACFDGREWKSFLRKSFDNGYPDSGFMLLLVSKYDKNYPINPDDIARLILLVKKEEATNKKINQNLLSKEDILFIQSNKFDIKNHESYSNKVSQRASEIITRVRYWIE